MDAGFSTPLLDFFRRGEVPRDVRLLAAKGALAPRAHEQLALLMLLVRDSDKEIASVADQTLSVIPEDSLSEFLARSDVSDATRAFFSLRGIEPAEAGSPDSDDPLFDSDEEDDEEFDESLPLVERIAGMSVAQRVVRAMKGSREERAILIRDPNKLVNVAVLSSPKLTDTEIEGIARMANVSEEVLRIIGRTRAWIKSYPVVVALARNPKTPVATSLTVLGRLMEKDLKTISTDHNVPDVLRATARRRVSNDK